MKKDERIHKTIGTAMDVHSIMGPGRLEAVYHEALEIEFDLRRVSYVSKPRVDIEYKDYKLKSYYIPDFLVLNEVVVEIKAESALTKVDEAQIINRLKCCGKKVGLLINFGESSLRWKRFVN